MQDDYFLRKKKRIIKPATILDLYSTKASVGFFSLSRVLTSILVYSRYVFNIQRHTKVSLNIFKVNTEMNFIKRQLFTGSKRVSVHLRQKGYPYISDVSLHPFRYSSTLNIIFIWFSSFSFLLNS